MEKEKKSIFTYVHQFSVRFKEFPCPYRVASVSLSLSLSPALPLARTWYSIHTSSVHYNAIAHLFISGYFFWPASLLTEHMYVRILLARLGVFLGVSVYACGYWWLIALNKCCLRVFFFFISFYFVSRYVGFIFHRAAAATVVVAAFVCVFISNRVCAFAYVIIYRLLMCVCECMHRYIFVTL